VYIWVLPGGREELAKLTLAILNYSVNQPAPILVKDVQLNLDAQGNPTTGPPARTIRATIPATIPSVARLKGEVAPMNRRQRSKGSENRCRPCRPCRRFSHLRTINPSTFSSSTKGYSS
jgi:hypothetical protein